MVNTFGTDFIVLHVVNPFIEHRELDFFQESRGIKIVVSVENIVARVVAFDCGWREIMGFLLFHHSLMCFI